MEDPKNFLGVRVISVVRTARGSEGIMDMLGKANQALRPVAYFINDEKFANHVVRRVPISVHPSQNRVLKFTFLQRFRTGRHH